MVSRSKLQQSLQQSEFIQKPAHKNAARNKTDIKMQKLQKKLKHLKDKLKAGKGRKGVFKRLKIKYTSKKAKWVKSQISKLNNNRTKEFNRCLAKLDKVHLYNRDTVYDAVHGDVPKVYDDVSTERIYTEVTKALKEGFEAGVPMQDLKNLTKAATTLLKSPGDKHFPNFLQKFNKVNNFVISKNHLNANKNLLDAMETLTRARNMHKEGKCKVGDVINAYDRAIEKALTYKNNCISDEEKLDLDTFIETLKNKKDQLKKAKIPNNTKNTQNSNTAPTITSTKNKTVKETVNDTIEKQFDEALAKVGDVIHEVDEIHDALKAMDELNIAKNMYKKGELTVKDVINAYDIAIKKTLIFRNDCTSYKGQLQLDKLIKALENEKDQLKKAKIPNNTKNTQNSEKPPESPPDEESLLNKILKAKKKLELKRTSKNKQQNSKTVSTGTPTKNKKPKKKQTLLDEIKVAKGMLKKTSTNNKNLESQNNHEDVSLTRQLSNAYNKVMPQGTSQHSSKATNVKKAPVSEQEWRDLENDKTPSDEQPNDNLDITVNDGGLHKRSNTPSSSEKDNPTVNAKKSSKKGNPPDVKSFKFNMAEEMARHAEEMKNDEKERERDEW